MGAPSASRSGMPRPLRKIASDVVRARPQSSGVMCWPSGRSHAMSWMSEPTIGLPWKNRCRRKIGCRVRSSAIRATYSLSTSLSRARSQSTHASSLSWQ